MTEKSLWTMLAMKNTLKEPQAIDFEDIKVKVATDGSLKLESLCFSSRACFLLASTVPFPASVSSAFFICHVYILYVESM